MVQKVSKGEEALTRRKAYDAHLKTDILLSGRDKSMNKTFDPYYHPYWVANPHLANASLADKAINQYQYQPYKPQ